MFTQCLGGESMRHGVRVVAVNPGPTVPGRHLAARDGTRETAVRRREPLAGTARQVPVRPRRQSLGGCRSWSSFSPPIAPASSAAPRSISTAAIPCSARTANDEPTANDARELPKKNPQKLRARRRLCSLGRRGPKGAAMSFYEKGAVRIHYEEAGSGFPLLVIPGGGLNSTIAGLSGSNRPSTRSRSSRQSTAASRRTCATPMAASPPGRSRSTGRGTPTPTTTSA